MQIIIRKSDNVAVYMFDEGIKIIINTIMIQPLVALDISTVTHAVIANVPAPETFVGGALAWRGGEWVVLDQTALDRANILIPEPVPHEITNWQCKKQLIIDGKYDRVNAAVSTMDTAAQVDWLHAAVFRRDYPLIAQMQALLERTDAETDEFFIAASKLK